MMLVLMYHQQQCLRTLKLKMQPASFCFFTSDRSEKATIAKLTATSKIYSLLYQDSKRFFISSSLPKKMQLYKTHSQFEIQFTVVDAVERSLL